MVVCNTLFKKRDSICIIYSSGACNSQIGYLFVRNKDRKLVKDVKVIPSEEVVSQHHFVVSDVKIKPCKVEKQPFIPKRRVWKLKEHDIKENFANDFKNVTELMLKTMWKTF